MVALRDGDPAAVRTIDSFRQLRLDQSSDVVRVARSAEAGEISPSDALADLQRTLRMPSRFGTVSYIASHALLTLGLGWVIGPASGDFWWYRVLGSLVGAMNAWAQRHGSGGALVALVAAALVSAIAFLSQSGNETASLRLIIPPLVTFLPGALLTMATVDLAMGETVTGASRFVAGLLQLALLAIAIVIGAAIVGNSHTGAPARVPVSPDSVPGLRRGRRFGRLAGQGGPVVLTPIPDLPATVVGVEAHERVTAEDYDNVLIPAVEAAESASSDGKVRMRYVLGREFPDFTAGAAWEDTKLGLGRFRHWSASPSWATPTGCGVQSTP